MKGTRDGASVIAAEISVDDDEDGDDEDTELRGAVSGLIGICPGLTFFVSGTRVVTDAATRFEDGTCTTLRNDMRVEVDGRRQSDGSLLATEVDRES